MVFDIDFVISFEMNNDRYYEIDLICNDTCYSSSVNASFYEEAPNIFLEHPEIIKKILLKNKENIHFFSILKKEDILELSFVVDMNFITENIKLIFTKCKISDNVIIETITERLYRAKSDIKKLQKETSKIELLEKRIDDLTMKEWIIYESYDYDDPFIKIIDCYEKYNSLPAQDKNKRCFRQIPFGNTTYCLIKYDPLKLIKIGNNCKMTGYIHFPEFSNKLMFPKMIFPDKIVVEYLILTKKPYSYTKPNSHPPSSYTYGHSILSMKPDYYDKFLDIKNKFPTCIVVLNKICETDEHSIYEFNFIRNNIEIISTEASVKAFFHKGDNFVIDIESGKLDSLSAIDYLNSKIIKKDSYDNNLIELEFTL